MNESLGAALMIAGLIILGLGTLWLIIRAFARGFWRDLFAPLMLFLRPSKGLYPTLLMLLGGLVVASPWIVHAIRGSEIDRDAKVNVDTLTLTGAKPEHVELIRTTPNLRVLQWSDPSVTDTQLDRLRGKTSLEELDLNGTAITDEGLKVLATLPKLKSLRIARTKITDEGFRTHLLPLENLDQLDLTGTTVKPSTLREWANRKPGRVRPST